MSAVREEYLTAKQVADLLHISTDNVYRWAACGWLPPPLRLGKGHVVRWTRAALDSFLRQRGATHVGA
jgi:excisionase family DNA binding protein